MNKKSVVGLSVDVEQDYPPHMNSCRGIIGLRFIVNLLREHGADATFFISMKFLEDHPEVLDYVKGFELGCHGYKHVDLTRLGGSELHAEFDNALRVMEEYSIQPTGFRAPYARVDSRVLELVKSRFLYDSSVAFPQSLVSKCSDAMKEIPIYCGGKTFGISPPLFNALLHVPHDPKVFFIHPWEYGGVSFKELSARRVGMKFLSYRPGNYVKNLVTVLEEKPVRLSGLL